LLDAIYFLRILSRIKNISNFDPFLFEVYGINQLKLFEYQVGINTKPGDLTSVGIQYYCLFSTFWLDPKSSQKDQDFEFDSLCRSYSERIFLPLSKGFSADFVTRCLTHELAAMLSIRV
jgi:hypothetical protein